MRKFTFPLLVFLVVFIGFLHFVTPGEYHLFHSTYRRLSYFPIVLGGVWFGLRGGFILSVLASIAFIPHLLLYIGSDPNIYIGELTEVILYLAAGIVTGFISGREMKLREKYKKLSEELQDSYSRLHEQAKLLLDVEEQLADKQKFSALGKLSASLAHEIKNPLSSIKGTAEIIMDEFSEDHPKREFADILLKEIARLNRTVDEILSYAQNGPLDEGGREPVVAVVDRVAMLLATHLRKKKVTFVVNKDIDDSYFLPADRFSQVLLNIILNAIDAVEAGGHIALNIGMADDWLVFDIVDDGPGVGDELKEKIFQPFYSSKKGGTGLGLQISRKIVESFGGQIVVRDAEKGGAIFSIRIPERTLLK